MADENQHAIFWRFRESAIRAANGSERHRRFGKPVTDKRPPRCSATRNYVGAKENGDRYSNDGPRFVLPIDRVREMPELQRVFSNKTRANRTTAICVLVSQPDATLGAKSQESKPAAWYGEVPKQVYQPQI